RREAVCRGPLRRKLCGRGGGKPPLRGWPLHQGSDGPYRLFLDLARARISRAPSHAAAGGIAGGGFCAERTDGRHGDAGRHLHQPRSGKPGRRRYRQRVLGRVPRAANAGTMVGHALPERIGCMSLYRNFINVGAMTTGSRILGFVRDALVAAVLGTGPAADAYLAAFRFPNLFRRLFAEGAFNTAFIPLFAKSLEQEGMEPARLWAARIMSWLVVVVTGVTILVEIFMPWILPIFVPGFLDDKAKFELTVLLTRICFPYLMCMSLMAAYAAILNGLGRFTASSFAPILLNVVMIAFMLPLVLYRNTDVQTAIWIAVGTLAGGVAQLAMVYA